MADLLVLTEGEVRQALTPDELVRSMTEALVALSERTTSVPARVAALSQDGLLAAMPGYVPGMGLAAKLVTVYSGNPGRGRDAHQALIAVFDETTGAPRAVMGATYITAARTAVTSALAARALARSDSRSVAIIGAGPQARAHLDAVTKIIGPEEVRVSSRDASKAALMAEQHPGAMAVPFPREAVEGADIVLCCTASPTPVLEDGWIGPGAHVSSVGSGAELPAGLLSRASVFVESRMATAPPPAGAAELQGRDPLTLTELGAVLSKRSSGRSSRDEVTVFKSTGHAVEDVAAAAVVLRRARVLGLGTPVASFS